MVGVVLQTVAGLVVSGLLLRVAIGAGRRVRWSPRGDPALVAAMAAARPRVRSRVACAVLDRSSTGCEVRSAFVGCDASTVFELGSVTKAVTGLLLVDAVGRGEIALDTTLGAVWPELATRPCGDVTVDELARHRGGLPGTPLGRTAVPRALLFAAAGLDPYRGVGARDLVRIAGRAALRQRGAERYSNLGGALAGHALAQRAGTTFPDLFRRRLGDPLGLPATSVAPDVPRRAGRGPLGAWVQPWRMDGYGPAGALTSTLHDTTRLLAALLDGSCPGAAALEQGLFWQTFVTADGYRRIWHNGQTGGYSAYVAVYPEAGRAVAVLAAHADVRAQERLAGACVAATRRTRDH